uniref:Uncharacterized protein n=1 Tax=viral metagenome TaxID=1070528 RepID=A0A6C0ACD3_9ZZZZ
MRMNDSEYWKIAAYILIPAMVINSINLILVSYYRKLKSQSHPSNLFINGLISLTIYLTIRLCFNNNNLSYLQFENRNSFNNLESIGHAIQGFLSVSTFLFADYFLIVSFLSKVILVIYPVYNLIKRMMNNFNGFYNSSYNNNLFEWITGFYIGLVVGFLIKIIIEINLKNNYSVNRPKFVSKIFAFLSFILSIVASISSIVSGVQTNNTTEKWLLFIIPNYFILATFASILYKLKTSTDQNTTKDYTKDNVAVFENPLFGSDTDNYINNSDTNSFNSVDEEYSDIYTDTNV